MLYETSLLSIDVGFDIKDQSTPVILDEADYYKIKYEDKYSRQLLAVGDKERVLKTLRKAGYKVEVKKNEQG